MVKIWCGQVNIGLTKFEENPEGSSFFCVDLTWNDPSAIFSFFFDNVCTKLSTLYKVSYYKC